MSSRCSPSARSSSSSRSTGASGAARRHERRHADRLPARPRRGLGVFVDRSADLPDGISYLEFVAPGLLAATAMQVATFESSSPVLSAIKWDRQYHAMLATPLRVHDIVLGHQTFFAFRLLLTATVYFVVITAFGAMTRRSASSPSRSRCSSASHSRGRSRPGRRTRRPRPPSSRSSGS